MTSLMTFQIFASSTPASRHRSIMLQNIGEEGSKGLTSFALSLTRSSSALQRSCSAPVSELGILAEKRQFVKRLRSTSLRDCSAVGSNVSGLNEEARTRQGKKGQCGVTRNFASTYVEIV